MQSTSDDEQERKRTGWRRKRRCNACVHTHTYPCTHTHACPHDQGAFSEKEEQNKPLIKAEKLYQN